MNTRLLPGDRLIAQHRRRANQRHPLFRPVREIVLKTEGLADVLRNAVAWAAPAQEVVLPGGSVALRIAVKNAVLPLTLRINVEALVPTGGDVVAVYDDGEDRGNVVVWFDDLMATTAGEYRCVLRLPAELAGCVVRVDAAYLKGGSYRTVGTLEVPVQ